MVMGELPGEYFAALIMNSSEDESRNFELHRSLLRFVAQLSPPLRKAFQLRELDGLSTSEAAHVLGIADGTVKAQLARARASSGGL
jgi:RNA polymerase sigma factor (sigma-70 family)